MNLQTEITEVRSALAEPYRTVASSAFVTDDDCVRWITMGEQAAYDALDDRALANMAVDSSSISLTGAEGLTSGTDATVNWSRVLGVYVTKSSLSMRCILLSPQEFWNARKGKWAGSVDQEVAYATVDYQTVRVYSMPGVSACVVRYLPRPTQRAKFFGGLTTGAGSSTSVVASGAGGYANSWFVGCNLRMRTGAAASVEQVVSAFATGTGTFTVASLGATSGSGNSVDVGEISSLPAECMPAWIAYATYRGFLKKFPERAESALAHFERSVSSINARYAVGTPIRGRVLNEMEGQR